MSSEVRSLSLRIAARTLSLEVITAELAEQTDVQAIVVKSNRSLLPLDRASEAVYDAAGPRHRLHCQQLAADDVPQRWLVTDGFDLRQSKLLHFLGTLPRRHPLFVDDLSATYGELIELCERECISSVALAPLADAAGIRSVWTEAGIIKRRIREGELHHLEYLRFILSSRPDADRFFNELRQDEDET